jgi:Ca2+-binding EF-hand superfamily protein
MSQLGIEDSLSSDEFIAQYDSDSNGEITKAEMDAARPPMGPSPRRTVTDELPTDIDTDGDGSLSADEYEAMISNLNIEEALTSEEFFTQYDTDQDGEITAAELNAYTAKAFNAYESNYQFISEEDEANVNSIA